MEVKYILISGTESTSLGESSINDFQSESPSEENVNSSEGISENDALLSENFEESILEEPSGNLSGDESVESNSPESSEGFMEDDSLEEGEETTEDDLLVEKEFSSTTPSNVEELPEEELTEEFLVDTENLFFTKPFESYTVVEGLLLLIFVILLFKFCIDMMYKLLHWRMF